VGKRFECSRAQTLDRFLPAQRSAGALGRAAPAAGPESDMSPAAVALAAAPRR
jgi:hypothetical protein